MKLFVFLKKNLTWIIKKFFIGLIRIYQIAFSSFVSGNCCRFYPSCSEYSIAAIKELGVIKGIVYTVRRLVKCNPYNAGGLDFVPNKEV